LFYTTLSLLGLFAGLTFGLGLQPFDHPFHLLTGAPGLLAAATGYQPIRATKEASL
jgi:hypothetical protein